MLAPVTRFGIHVVLAVTLLHGGTICVLPGTGDGPGNRALALAAEVLRQSDAVYASSVGEGVTPPEALAWRVVAGSSPADSVFRSLVRAAPRPARLYALAYLQHSDPEAYRRFAAREREQGGVVRTMSGCIMWERPVDELLVEMDRGEWTRDLWFGPAPSQLTLTQR